MKRLLVVGGGAAGLMAALAAAWPTLVEDGEAKRFAPLTVTVAEAGERVGKKLLATGNGRCNLLNLRAQPKDYALQPPKAVVHAFPPARVLTVFARLGLCVREEGEGRVYPASNQASSVLDVLRLGLERAGVAQRTGFAVQRLTRRGDRWLAESQDGQRLEADAVLLSGGGRAASKHTGYALAQSIGHSVSGLKPALGPLKTEASALRGLSGVRVHCGVSLRGKSGVVGRETGELLFRDNALSGIAVFQLSRLAARMRGALEIEVDLLPQLTQSEAIGFLRQRAMDLDWRERETFFAGLLHKRVAEKVLRAADMPPGRVSKWSPAEVDRLASVCKGWRHPVLGDMGWEACQVTVGGVPLAEVEPGTLASLRSPGLYLAGELMDVDGPCGGYNLYWAWASGLAAGAAAGRALRGGTP